MSSLSRTFESRVQSARLRIADLSSLRRRVALPPRYDITKRQWSALELSLSAAEARLRSRLNRASDQYLGNADDVVVARSLNSVLGEIELELSRAFTFFDTYMDVISQRYMADLGPVLAGCDVLAWEAIKRDHPALRLTEPPLVFCDRGFGASIIRESVTLPDGTANPIPLIQIPYSRLKEKCNLTSILHEAGHQALARLGLVHVIPGVIRAALARSGAGNSLRDLFALWSSEIGPDFWTFCAAGIAGPAGIREILALPPGHVFRVSWTDPHPPPYLRVLLSFEWCRFQWGRGPWDLWEEQWTALYPVESAAAGTRALLKEGLARLGVVARALLTTRFRALNGRTIPELFNLNAIAPATLARVAAGAASGRLDLTGLMPSAQLAVFRLIKERGLYSEERLDRVMTEWLVRLGQRRHSLD